jgi:hypothetical protein
VIRTDGSLDSFCRHYGNSSHSSRTNLTP